MSPLSNPIYVSRDRLEGQWTGGIQNELTPGNLLDLSRGRIPAVHLAGFLDEPTSSVIRRAYSNLAHGYYRDVAPRISKFGPAVFEHEFAERERYFAEANTTRDVLSSVMNGASPLVAFQRTLQECCGWRSGPARDRAFGDYFAGNLRSIEEGTPVHIDFAPFESPGWDMISSVEAQLAANVYVDATSDGGRLVIYDRAWALEDEQYRFRDRFGYDDAVVEAASFEVITPVGGDLVLFNSRFFHRVEACWHRRLTFSFFFAFRDDQLILWS